MKFDNHKDGFTEMMQKGLIQKILKATMIDHCNPNGFPTAMTSLGADKQGEPVQKSWSCRAVCGMLLHLSTNTHADTAHTVSQVCRFGHQPTKKHDTTAKTTIRHPKGAQDKGIIFCPSKWFELDFCADTNFCGLFKHEDDRNPDSARSRTQHVILLNGCLVLWKLISAATADQLEHA